ncbi:hypothetical protein ACGF7U_31380 [Micromonospora sp. NPDC047670]|uniref:hypothetical protein n=1 Tax=Micromonospora sp. NPDC047670 TaxID=3364252 RepID=UPI003714CFB5
MTVKFDELRGDITYGVTVPPTAAGTAVEVPIIRLPFAALITEILWIPSAAMAANASNYATLTVRNRQAGAGNIAIASRAYNAGNGMANVPEVLAQAGSNETLMPAAGDVLTAHFTHTGTGLAVPAGLVQIKLRIR